VLESFIREVNRRLDSLEESERKKLFMHNEDLLLLEVRTGSSTFGDSVYAGRLLNNEAEGST
jgi:hypothetical protein